jgi:hypothetical protein
MAGILRTDTIQNSNTSTIITQTNSTTITIGTSGQTVALASGASSSGFGATYNGAVNWDTTPKTTTVTAASGVGYFINTTSGAVTVNLPVGVVGATIALADYANTWQTNNVTVNANGSEKIGGVVAPATLSVQGQSVTFTYVDSTQGWKNTQDSTSNVIGVTFMSATGGTITTCGNFKIHTFTGPGTFTVSALASNPSNSTVEYLVVAGGGGGGGSLGGGGGGAGGYRTNFPSAGTPITITSYPITVGAGGSTVPNPQAAMQGSNSIFSTITSTGGGGGIAYPGGSGGGGQHRDYPVGGAGNTPPVSPPQGQPGGSTPLPEGYGGAGGGGHSTAGTQSGPAYGPVSNQGGAPGGSGSPNLISGSSISYSGGGGGGGFSQGGGLSSGGTGGTGGGGTGATGGPGPSTGIPAVAGTANSGGGGGGQGYRANSTTVPGANGGSGIVILRYRYQ